MKRTPQCEHPERQPGEPTGYLGWHDWAEEYEKTHVQQKCTHCGLWAIWRPRLKAV